MKTFSKINLAVLIISIIGIANASQTSDLFAYSIVALMITVSIGFFLAVNTVINWQNDREQTQINNTITAAGMIEAEGEMYRQQVAHNKQLESLKIATWTK